MSEGVSGCHSLVPRARPSSIHPSIHPSDHHPSTLHPSSIGLLALIVHLVAIVMTIVMAIVVAIVMIVTVVVTVPVPGAAIPRSHDVMDDTMMCRLPCLLPGHVSRGNGRRRRGVLGAPG